jgi:hypothetical protein
MFTNLATFKNFWSSERSSSSDNDQRAVFGGCPNILTSESGFITWGTLFSVMLMMILLSLVANSANSVNRKLETQNAADAVAYSPMVWLARGMNAVTATNHIIGEINALYVMHHSLGGKYLDEEDDPNETSEMQSWSRGVEIGGNVCRNFPLPALDIHYDPDNDGSVGMIPAADKNSTIYEAKLQLMQIMVGAYVAHAVGGGLSQSGFPPTVAAGWIIMTAAYVVEWKVYQESLVLYGVELVANKLSPLKKKLPLIIDALFLYQQVEVIVQFPVLAYMCADPVAKKHGARGFALADFPDGIGLDDLTQFFPKLPIEKEETSNESRSQMLRATYPWVAHWRKNTRTFFLYTCTLSGAEGDYEKWTNTYSREASEWLRFPTDREFRKRLTQVNGSGSGENGRGVHLYVMMGLKETSDGITKSREDWNQDDISATLLADERFCIMGFAKTPKSWVASRPFFRQENPFGMFCYSQAMLYNGNEEQRPADSRGNGQRQPNVGWDTLNWNSNEAIEWKTSDDLDNPPRIKLNWQAKLTPVTLAKMTKTIPMAALMDGDIRRIMGGGPVEIGADLLKQLWLQNH